MKKQACENALKTKERKERYHIDGSMLVTDNYHIPMDFIINFLQANGCIEQKDVCCIKGSRI